jgi:hypothetical protein
MVLVSRQQIDLVLAALEAGENTWLGANMRLITPLPWLDG